MSADYSSLSESEAKLWQLKALNIPNISRMFNLC